MYKYAYLTNYSQILPWKSGILVKKRANNFAIRRKKNFLSVASSTAVFFLQELLPCELEKPQQMIAFYIPLIRLGNLIQVGMHGNVVLFMVTLLHGINLFFRLWSLMLNILKPYVFLKLRQSRKQIMVSWVSWVHFVCFLL